MNINLRDGNLLLLHKGVITPDLINLVVEALEQSVTNLEPDKKVRRKLTNVFIEVFQNIGYHGVKHPSFLNSDLVIVIKRPDYYKVGTSNIIEQDKVEVIKSTIDKVNNMNPEELREYYKLVLENNDMSDKGTAGLGFVDVARKTGQRLYYEFLPVDDLHSHFYFETRVLTDYSQEKTIRANKMVEGE